jgi:hypothetical protein
VRFYAHPGTTLLIRVVGGSGGFITGSGYLVNLP